MGTLSERDQSYLAQNFLAFFRRDYHRVATAHLESGWVPADTRVDELEAEIRVVLEPVFDRPLSEISLGRVLLQLFRASRRFNIEIQPQLVLLQKTLLNVEGLGRQLDPELDLWVTAMPYLERWMNDRIGLPALKRRLLAEAPYIVAALPELPRLLHQRLTAPPAASDEAIKGLAAAQRARNGLLAVVAVLLAAIAGTCCFGNCARAEPLALALESAVFFHSRKAPADGAPRDPERDAPFRRFHRRRRRQPRASRRANSSRCSDPPAAARPRSCA